MSNWQEYEFSTLCDITRGASPRPIHEWISEEGIPWMKISDASTAYSRFIQHTKERIKPGGSSKSVSVLPGDLILSNSATPGIPKFLKIKACIHDGWLLLRDFRHIDKLFCYYLLLFERPHLLQQGNGTVFTNLKTEILKKHRVKIPPLSEQRAIAHILGTLDDKIELNRHMNETLEEMARALFKSWFVDFDPVRAKMEGRDPGLPKHIADLFPDQLVESELGEIPEGWEVKLFGDIVNRLGGNVNPFTYPDTVFSHFSIPAYDEGQLPKQELGREIKSTKTRVPPGAVLLSKLNPEIERVWLVDVMEDEAAICSTEFLVLQDRPPIQRSYIYCLACNSLFREQIKSLVTGTSKSHQRARANDITKLEVVFPPGPIAQAFESRASELLNHGLACRREIRTLAALLDALLPRLVSGEIRLREAEKAVEVVT